MAEPITDDRALMHPEDRESFGAAFERIVGVMARLRGPGGCPWDRVQTLATMKPYLIEEAYEVIEAIEEGGAEAHEEELGDLLLQIVFQAEIRRGEGAFDAADVAHGIADKLVRRHPHVFGDQTADGEKQAYAHWEAMKAREKAGRSAIAGVPRRLPALHRAQRITEKAAKVGFDWKDARGPKEKLAEEAKELDEAVASGDREKIAGELGDLLFSVVNLARHLGVSAEDALNATTEKFSRRFAKVEEGVKSTGRRLEEATLEEMDALWEQAKKDGL